MSVDIFILRKCFVKFTATNITVYALILPQCASDSESILMLLLYMQRCQTFFIVQTRELWRCS